MNKQCILNIFVNVEKCLFKYLVIMWNSRNYIYFLERSGQLRSFSCSLKLGRVCKFCNPNIVKYLTKCIKKIKYFEILYFHIDYLLKTQLLLLDWYLLKSALR